MPEKAALFTSIMQFTLSFGQHSYLTSAVYLSPVLLAMPAKLFMVNTASKLQLQTDRHSSHQGWGPLGNGNAKGVFKKPSKPPCSTAWLAHATLLLAHVILAKVWRNKSLVWQPVLSRATGLLAPGKTTFTRTACSAEGCGDREKRAAFHQSTSKLPAYSRSSN